MIRRLLAASLLLLSTGCIFDEPPRATSNRRIGVTAVDDGFEIFVALCPGETVAAVDGYAFIGPILADDDDELIWRVEAQPPVAGATFTAVIGQTPEDFDEALPLPEDAIEQMTGDVGPAVIVTLPGGQGGGEVGIAFDPHDVPESGYLDSSGDVVPLESIEAGLDELCPAEPSS